MIPIRSTVENFTTTFARIHDLLSPEGFVLGGGYTYDHRYFDHPLDWEEDQGYHYYLRIPVFAIEGDIGDEKTKVQLGKPFVIKHEFLTGNDPSADVGILTSLVNQFSKPIPAENDPIDEKWVIRAQGILTKIEGKITDK